jgi:hypothetical protein
VKTKGRITCIGFNDLTQNSEAKVGQKRKRDMDEDELKSIEASKK